MECYYNIRPNERGYTVLYETLEGTMDVQKTSIYTKKQLNYPVLQHSEEDALTTEIDYTLHSGLKNTWKNKQMYSQHLKQETPCPLLPLQCITADTKHKIMGKLATVNPQD